MDEKYYTINEYVQDCIVVVELEDGREFELILDDDSIAWCDGWHYCFVNSFNALMYIIREFIQMKIEIEEEDIAHIYYECFDLI